MLKENIPEFKNLLMIWSILLKCIYHIKQAYFWTWKCQFMYVGFPIFELHFISKFWFAKFFKHIFIMIRNIKKYPTLDWEKSNLKAPLVKNLKSTTVAIQFSEILNSALYFLINLMRFKVRIILTSTFVWFLTTWLSI